MEFESFGKIPRLSRECLITEKIDGTNAQIGITENSEFYVGSRNRWLVAPNGVIGENYGFASWALQNKDELIAGLGPGRHFGEWWGPGIQRGYGIGERRFSLFNAKRWTLKKPDCCHVVPILYQGVFSTDAVDQCLAYLAEKGSVAAPGFMQPEGIIVQHYASGTVFKKTIDDAG